MPEGVTLNPELTESLKTLAAENGWDQTTAQKVANLGAQMAQQQTAAVEAMRNQWTADAKADTEIGGENFDANVAKANAVIDAVADKEFVEFLAKTGLSNHPSMIRTFTRLHAAIGEDTLVNGMPKPGEGPKTQEGIMFPTMNQA